MLRVRGTPGSVASTPTVRADIWLSSALTFGSVNRGTVPWHMAVTLEYRPPRLRTVWIRSTF
ncbi:hypothetical protein MSKU3_3325 [Komagataeibacter oboediens]|nr:hypothetical protein MSKU3_3325 [Komagataeibacter oboediens]